MRKTFWGEVSFFLHLPIFIFWVGAFFVPESVWPDVVLYHFWFIVAMYVFGYTTGLYYMRYTKSLLMICVLTLLTQRLRGYAWTEEKNWGHSFLGELFARLSGKTKPAEKNQSGYGPGTLIMHATLVLVSIQYFFGILVL